jgi:hypothetical protein
MTDVETVVAIALSAVGACALIVAWTLLRQPR